MLRGRGCFRKEGSRTDEAADFPDRTVSGVPLLVEAELSVEELLRFFFSRLAALDLCDFGLFLCDDRLVKDRLNKCTRLSMLVDDPEDTSRFLRRLDFFSFGG